MNWGLYHTILATHILLAIIWVGGILFVGWAIFPSVKVLNYKDQQKFLYHLMKRTHWVLTSVGIGVIITGTILGTILGPIEEWQDLWNSPYGIKWISAFVTGMSTLCWGIFIGYKKAIQVLTEDWLWEAANNGDSIPLNKALKLTARFESVELIGFITLLVIMILFP